MRRRDVSGARQMGNDMAKDWRISSFNGVLLAAYFIPIWTIIAFRIVASPVHGLYERPNISVALFIAEHAQLAAVGTVRAAWLLALGRLTVVAFFTLFLVLVSRPTIRKAGGCDEALAVALGIGSLISFAGMVMAAQVGEPAALQLHATELLLLLGNAILLAVEGPVRAPADRAVAAQTAQRFTLGGALRSLAMGARNALQR
jgi:hypothetical protein